MGKTIISIKAQLSLNVHRQTGLANHEGQGKYGTPLLTNPLCLSFVRDAQDSDVNVFPKAKMSHKLKCYYHENLQESASTH